MGVPELDVEVAIPSDYSAEQSLDELTNNGKQRSALCSFTKSSSEPKHISAFRCQSSVRYLTNNMILEVTGFLPLEGIRTGRNSADPF